MREVALWVGDVMDGNKMLISPENIQQKVEHSLSGTGTPHLSVSVKTASQYGSFARSSNVGNLSATDWLDPNPSPLDRRTLSSSSWARWSTWGC